MSLGSHHGGGVFTSWLLFLLLSDLVALWKEKRPVTGKAESPKSNSAPCINYTNLWVVFKAPLKHTQLTEVLVSAVSVLPKKTGGGGRAVWKQTTAAMEGVNE